MKDPYLEVSKLEVVYHHVSTAIQGVSLSVAKGQIFVLLGANGAGKTTTLRAVSGFLGSDNADITDGDIVFMNRRITGQPPHKITKMGIVLVPEREKVFETLTTEENLALPCAVNDQPKEDRRWCMNIFRGFMSVRRPFSGSVERRRKTDAGYRSGDTVLTKDTSAR